MSEAAIKSLAGKTSRAVRQPKLGMRGDKIGLVRDCVRGSRQNADQGHFTSPELIAALNAGLPFGELLELQVTLNVALDQLAAMLGISKATLHRRQTQGRLDPAESDRALRYARLTGQAIEVMESEADARKWLKSPQFGLGGAVPLEYARTEIGAREIEHLLGRIEHGVYS